MSSSVSLWFRKGGFFVDLFVRVSNQVAVNMYKQLGYSVYRTVIEYYSASNGEPDEDAYGGLFTCVIITLLFIKFGVGTILIWKKSVRFQIKCCYFEL